MRHAVSDSRCRCPEEQFGAGTEDAAAARGSVRTDGCGNRKCASNG